MATTTADTKLFAGLWYRRESDCILIGIDPALCADGNGVAFVEIAVETDAEVEEGEPLGLVEMKRGREFEIEAPCAARVIEIRPGLPDEVSGINADPLGQWLLKIRPRAKSAWSRIPS